MATKQEGRFYIYVIKDGDVVLYVGKGSGKRLAVQKRRFGADGEIIARFMSEKKAFASERRWIETLKPEMNKHPGGCGGRVRRRHYRRERIYSQAEIRRYSARLLLECERSRPGIIDQSKLDAIRQVANGCRC